MDVSVTKKLYGWTKWGGANRGMAMEELDTWCCQACGRQQLKHLPQYYIPIDKWDRDYVRVCALCKHVYLLKRLTRVQDLFRWVKKPPTFFNVANLPTLPFII